MKNISFIKMHGIGNDFVIIDERTRNKSFFPGLVTTLANRRLGIGCDQLVIIEKSKNADCKVRFFNPDGSESSTCGNATRCVAHLIMQNTHEQKVNIETNAGILECFRAGTNLVSVNMGIANFDWQNIPLAYEADTLKLPISSGPLSNPVAVNVGNPHAVFFVDDVNEVDLIKYAPALETHKIFPEKANIGIAQIINPSEILLRVWERGTGETFACGSGACAALVAAFRKKLTKNFATITLVGGQLSIEVQEDGSIFMTGSVAEVFTGEFEI